MPSIRTAMGALTMYAKSSCSAVNEVTAISTNLLWPEAVACLTNEEGVRDP